MKTTDFLHCFTKKRILKSIFFLLIYLFCFILSASGEGSALYNISGNRLYLFSSTGYVKFYTYVEAGDNLYIGTSSYRNKISVLMPGATSSQDFTNLTATDPGVIADYTQETSGPKPFSSSGYEPIVITASQGGVAEITIGTSDYCNVRNVMLPFPGGTSTSQCIAAWDITVADNSGSIKNGRVFTDFIRPRGTNVNGLDAYILTADGYIYSFSTGEMTCTGNCYIRVTNRGVTHTDSNKIAYTSNPTNSVMSYLDYQDAGEFAMKSEYFFNYSTLGDIAQKLFFSPPDTDLLNYLGVSTPRPVPTVVANKNFTFSGKLNGNQSLQGQGGTFSFESTADYGTYQIKITFPGDPSGSRTVIIADKLNFINEVEWDGRDRQGNIVTPGSYSVELELRAAETHITFIQTDALHDGVKVVEINPLDGTMDDTVYYNNAFDTMYGSVNHMNEIHCESPFNSTLCQASDYVLEGGNLVADTDFSKIYFYGPLDRTSGVHSSLLPAMKMDNKYGLGHNIDLWTYYHQTNKYYTDVDIVDPHFNLVVNKQWNDDNNRDHYRPESISFRLYADGVEYPEQQSYVIYNSLGWTVTIPDLPEYNSENKKISYSVREIP